MALKAQNTYECCIVNSIEMFEKLILWSAKKCIIQSFHIQVVWMFQYYHLNEKIVLNAVKQLNNVTNALKTGKI